MTRFSWLAAPLSGILSVEVIHMAKNLNQILGESSACEQFFASLPGYVQETIRERADSIHSENDLRRYAENLLENL